MSDQELIDLNKYTPEDLLRQLVRDVQSLSKGLDNYKKDKDREDHKQMDRIIELEKDLAVFKREIRTERDAKVKSIQNTFRIGALVLVGLQVAAVVVLYMIQNAV